MTIGRRLAGSFLGVLLAAAGVAIAPAQDALALSATADNTWLTNGKVYAVARADGITLDGVVRNVLFIGGDFAKVRELPTGMGGRQYAAANLAAIDLDTGAGIAAFTPDVTHSVDTVAVRSLAVSADRSTLYVGGHFDSVDGISVLNFAAIDIATGAANAAFPQVGAVGNTGNNVYTILPSANKVYIGGAFSAVRGKLRKKLAALNTDGTLDTSWKPQANKSVRTLAFAPDGNTIFVGGGFTTINGVARAAVARVNTTDGALDPWNIPSGTIGYPQTAWSLVASGNRLYGGFGRGPNYAAAFRLDNGTSGNQTWLYRTVGNVQAVALSASGDRLYIGGHFGMGELQQTVRCGNQNVALRGLAFIANPATITSASPDCSWLPQLGPHGSNFQGVWALNVSSAYVWVGGGFETVGGVNHQSLARFTI